MISFSKAAGGIVQSEIRIMSIECEKVRGINLAQGICDTPVPEPVIRGAEEAMRAGRNSYVRLDGIAELRQAIARKLERDNHITADPDTEILVSSGSTGAFLSACFALLDPDDEVIVFEPYYGYHVNTLLACGARPVYVTLRPPDWGFSLDELTRAISPRTKAIVINSPGNPSGKVFDRQELESIAELARRHDLFVFTDEIYEYFLYDGREHISIATLPGMAERTITISGFSKTYSITGWRIGYAVCSARWKPALGYFHDLAFICAPSALQVGVARGLEELPESFYREMSSEYATKRRLLCETLREIGMKPYVPQGSYYVLAEAGALPGTNSKQRAMALLQETGVAAVPGEAFFHTNVENTKDGNQEVSNAGAGLLRFCFAKTESDLLNACGRLQRLAVSSSR